MDPELSRTTSRAARGAGRAGSRHGRRSGHDAAPAISDEARRQDEAWAAFVASLDPGSPPPFGEQLAAFRRIYSDRSEADGPPLVWRPSAAQVSASNAGRFMSERGFRSWEELRSWSASERPAFWEAVLERLAIRFRKPPSRILDSSGGVRDPVWLPGASMCIVDSCFKADPASPAVISGREGERGARTTSRAELESLVNRVAAGLRATGHRAGDAIALYMPMTLECVAAYLGIIRAGCAAVSIADSFSPSELRRRMGIAGARTVVTAARHSRGGKVVRLLEQVREADPALVIVVPGPAEGSAVLRRGELAWGDLLAAGSGAPAGAARAPAAAESASQDAGAERSGPPSRADGLPPETDTSVPVAAFSALRDTGREEDDPYRTINVLFSSGTTGTPKAIPWTQLTPIKCAMDGHFHQDIRAGDVVTWPTNIGWMMGPWLVFASLINDAALALWEGAPQGEGFRDFVREAGVTMLGVIPSLVRAWRAGGRYERPGWDRLRTFSSTGEPSSREDYLWLMSLAGYRAPVIEYLGGTEIGGGHITGSVVQPASPATFTTPALGIDLVLLDRDGRPVAEGGSGEMFLVPPALGLSQRLLNADHEAVYYAGAPRGPAGETLRRHGDEMARLHGGFFRALGRADDTMNLGGVKVSSIEIEQTVERDGAVRECAAVAVRAGGEGAERLVLFVVPARSVDRGDLLAGLGNRIARELNPLFRIHDLVLVEALPRTASNKLMRRELRARYQRGPSDESTARGEPPGRVPAP